jgi:hypothetical protein
MLTKIRIILKIIGLAFKELFELITGNRRWS